MKNEFFLMVDTDKAKCVLVNEDETSEPKEFRSEGQANSEGRRLINAGKAVKYRVLKTVSEQS